MRIVKQILDFIYVRNFYIILIRMKSQAVLSSPKITIQEKAIQKYPFSLNNQTYFASQCYFENAIVNGVSLQLKQAKGIPNQERIVSYFNYSNRLIFCVGVNIIIYNSYKRNYQIISESKNMVCLQAFSLSTAQKQYLVWVQKIQQDAQDMLNYAGNNKNYYCICVYDLTQKQKIYSQKFHAINCELKAQNVQLIAFMHPIKLLGVVFYDEQRHQTSFIYRKMAKANEQTEFGQQIKISLPYQFKFMQYDLQSNSYFFMKSHFEVGVLRCLIQNEDDDNFGLISKSQQNIQIEVLLKLDYKKLGSRKIIHFAINETYLLLLTCNEEESERYFQFYSLFSYELIFHEIIWKNRSEQSSFGTTKYINKDNQDCIQQSIPIDFLEFNKSIIIGLRGNSTEVSIFSLYQQNLRHIRDTILDLEYCYKIMRLFINPFSSEVMVMSRHYELEGAMTTAHKSTKVIRKAEARYKRFFMEISSFFITMESALVNVRKMSLQSKSYHNILISPWLSQFLIQTENSFRCRRWEQKFDGIIKCSAVHPTGQYIALGFNDCFKIYFLTHQGIAPSYVSESLKQCTSLCYSKTGNDLAAATTNNIFIYDCYSYLKKYQICLGMSYKIQEISYVEGYQNDKIKHCLQCVTTTKRLVLYNAQQDYKEQFAFNPKSHLQNNIFDGILSLVSNRTNQLNKMSFTVNPDELQNNKSKQVFEVSNIGSKKIGAIVYDEKTKVVIFSLGTKVYFISTINFQSLGAFDFQEITCIQLYRNINTMFLGTASGKIIAFPWPNKPINITSKLPTFNGHKTKIRKIKLSSNMYELISISDQTKYVHNVTLIQEMRKIHKHELQRQCNPKVTLALDFYLKIGACIYTSQQLQKKYETVKENEEEAVNLNFILPQQRQKQKVSMLNKIQGQRQKIVMDSQEQVMPMKMQAINLKDKLKLLQRTRKESINNFNNTIEKQTLAYHAKLSELHKQKDSLKKKYDQLTKQLQKKLQAAKEQLRLSSIKSQTIFRVKINEINKRANQADFNRKKEINNFFQLTQMDEEKKIYNQQLIKGIQSQISILVQRNGYLMSRNTNLEKQIGTKKRKIQDIKDLIHTTQRNIDCLPRRPKFSMKPEDKKQQQQINKQFAQTEKKYLKQTKKLIEKNKAINVSISLYEKERQMLIILQKQLEKQEKNIDDILDYIMQQRKFKPKLTQKIDVVLQKSQQASRTYERMNMRRIKAKNDLKNYLHKLQMYDQGIISLHDLKNLSNIQPQNMINSAENIQVSIDEKKRRIQKIQNTQDKVMNVMRNERKIYSNEKKKSSIQNQDLIVNFNFLLHQNKYLANVIKSQYDRKRNYIKTNNKKENQVTKLPTPFESYIKSKTSRRLRTTPCAQYDISS